MNGNIEQGMNIKAESQKTAKTTHTCLPHVSVCMPMYNASKYLRE